uniref:Uncharacterized protein n=1 Tax=viral metagenome TaxID=1070528 RepID=A0A6C0H6V4_9ZZZZ
MSRLGSHYQRYNVNDPIKFNSQQFERNDYQGVYSPQANQQWSVNQEVDIEYETVNYYLSVSSKDRDIIAYPNVNHYSVTFPELKNIHSIELIQSIIPDKNSVTDEPYLLLKIDEIDDVMVSNNKAVSDAFAILLLCCPTTPGGFIQMDHRVHEHTVKYYRQPKANLSRMTVTVTDTNGVPFNFGNDTPNPPNKGFQNTFVFKVVCLEKKRAALNFRSVY